MKGCLLEEAGCHLEIFYIDLLLTGSLLVLMSCYFGNLEATFTRQLLVVKGWLLGEAGGHLTNNTITNMLNFIYQWLGNCWSWRSDYLGRLKATLQYSNSHLSLTGQLLVVKGWPLGEAGGHLTNNTITNILNFIYQWLGNCWCWRGDYPGRVEATLQYSKFHLSLTGQLLVVKGWPLGEAGGHLTNNTITNMLNFIYQWLGNCWCWRGDYPERLEATWQYTKFHLSMSRQLLMLKMTIHGAWRPPYNILNFIYHWLGTCWLWKGVFWVSLEATLQYSKFHLSLTGQLLMVKVSMPMFSYTYLYIHVYTNSNE